MENALTLAIFNLLVSKWNTAVVHCCKQKFSLTEPIIWLIQLQITWVDSANNIALQSLLFIDPWLHFCISFLNFSRFTEKWYFYSEEEHKIWLYVTFSVTLDRPDPLLIACPMMHCTCLLMARISQQLSDWSAFMVTSPVSLSQE